MGGCEEIREAGEKELVAPTALALKPWRWLIRSERSCNGNDNAKALLFIAVTGDFNYNSTTDWCSLYINIYVAKS